MASQPLPVTLEVLWPRPPPRPIPPHHLLAQQETGPQPPAPLSLHIRLSPSASALQWYAAVAAAVRANPRAQALRFPYTLRLCGQADTDLLRHHARLQAVVAAAAAADDGQRVAPAALRLETVLLVPAKGWLLHPNETTAYVAYCHGALPQQVIHVPFSFAASNESPLLMHGSMRYLCWAPAQLAQSPCAVRHKGAVQVCQWDSAAMNPQTLVRLWRKYGAAWQCLCPENASDLLVGTASSFFHACHQAAQHEVLGRAASCSFAAAETSTPFHHAASPSSCHGGPDAAALRRVLAEALAEKDAAPTESRKRRRAADTVATAAVVAEAPDEGADAPPSVVERCASSAEECGSSGGALPIPQPPFSGDEAAMLVAALRDMAEAEPAITNNGAAPWPRLVANAFQVFSWCVAADLQRNGGSSGTPVAAALAFVRACVPRRFTLAMVPAWVRSCLRCRVLPHVPALATTHLLEAWFPAVPHEDTDWFTATLLLLAQAAPTRLFAELQRPVPYSGPQAGAACSALTSAVGLLPVAPCLQGGILLESSRTWGHVALPRCIAAPTASLAALRMRLLRHVAAQWQEDRAGGETSHAWLWHCMQLVAVVPWLQHLRSEDDDDGGGGGGPSSPSAWCSRQPWLPTFSSRGAMARAPPGTWPLVAMTLLAQVAYAPMMHDPEAALAAIHAASVPPKCARMAGDSADWLQQAAVDAVVHVALTVVLRAPRLHAALAARCTHGLPNMLRDWLQLQEQGLRLTSTSCEYQELWTRLLQHFPVLALQEEHALPRVMQFYRAGCLEAASWVAGLTGNAACLVDRVPFAAGEPVVMLPCQHAFRPWSLWAYLHRAGSIQQPPRHAGMLQPPTPFFRCPGCLQRVYATPTGQEEVVLHPSQLGAGSTPTISLDGGDEDAGGNEEEAGGHDAEASDATDTPSNNHSGSGSGSGSGSEGPSFGPVQHLLRREQQDHDDGRDEEVAALWNAAADTPLLLFHRSPGARSPLSPLLGLRPWDDAIDRATLWTPTPPDLDAASPSQSPGER